MAASDAMLLVFSLTGNHERSTHNFFPTSCNLISRKRFSVRLPAVCTVRCHANTGGMRGRYCACMIDSRWLVDPRSYRERMIKGIDMRKLALMAVLASTAFAAPAMARDKAWYVGVEGGGMIVEDMKFDINGVNDQATVKTKTGWDVDGILGYDFGMFRLEGETSYKQAKVKSAATSTVTGNGTLTGAPAGSYPDATGKFSVLSFMVNGLLDFGPDDGLNGYVGGGAGVARVREKGITLASGTGSMQMRASSCITLSSAKSILSRFTPA